MEDLAPKNVRITKIEREEYISKYVFFGTFFLVGEGENLEPVLKKNIDFIPYCIKN